MELHEDFPHTDYKICVGTPVDLDTKQEKVYFVVNKVSEVVEEESLELVRALAFVGQSLIEGDHILNSIKTYNIKKSGLSLEKNPVPNIYGGEGDGTQH